MDIILIVAFVLGRTVYDVRMKHSIVLLQSAF